MRGGSPKSAPRLILAERLIEGGQLDAALQAVDAHEDDHEPDLRSTQFRAEILLRRRDYQSAQDCFAKVCEAVEADPVARSSARAGRGAARYALGDIAQAIDDFEIAIDSGDRTARSWLTLAHALFAVRRDRDLAALSNSARSIGNLDAVTVRAVALVNAIAAYSNGDDDKAQQALEIARADAVSDESNQLGLEAYRRMIEAGIGGRDMPERRSLIATLGYQEYLEKLLEFRVANPAAYSGNATACLHVVGDSHTLSPVHTCILLDKIAYRVIAHPVIGAKAWHLAPDVNPAVTPQRKAFDRIGALLPAGEPTIAMFGEIDCRVNEGLFPFLTAHPEHDRAQYCRALTGSYVDAVTATLGAGKRPIMVCGVPAPHPIQAGKVGENARQFVELVHIFNVCLSEATRQAGLVFLDAHQLTALDDGIAAGNLHLDTIHLKPTVLRILLATAALGAGAI